jgi:hypothetical protein
LEKPSITPSTPEYSSWSCGVCVMWARVAVCV